MTDVLSVPVKLTDGQETTLNGHRGKVILVVNVASKCGLTVQYAGLQRLYEDKRERGFVIAAFPSNDFNGQEPGTNAEIVEFCTLTYDVTFPIFSKISVKGENQHPLYTLLTAESVTSTGDGPMRERFKSRGIESNDKDILWNFEKFLIARNGKVVERFAPDVTAEDQRLLSAIDRELVV